MKEYYILENKVKKGPFKKSELAKLNLNSETMIWFEGLEEWNNILEIENVKNLVKTQPPKTPNEIKTEKLKLNIKKSILRTIPWFILFLLISFTFMGYSIEETKAGKNIKTYRPDDVIFVLVSGTLILSLIPTIIIVLIKFRKLNTK